MFIHLQCHSDYSLLESPLRIKKILSLCTQHNMPAVALTDNGNMYGAVEFYAAAKNAGIKPILGCEMYLTKDFHVKERGLDRLILLATNFEGYQNLVQLVSTSHIEGFYYKPRIDLAHLQEKSEGLIAISPGMNGPVAYRLRSNDDEGALAVALKLQSIFGDRFYLGVQRLNVPFEDIVNEGTVDISKNHNIPLVATNDVYYESRETAYLKEILHCIQTGRTLDDDALDAESQEQYFKSPQEMAESLPDFPEAIANTVKIADQCNLDIQMDQVTLPRYECPDNMTPKDYLIKLVDEGIQAKYGGYTDVLRKRVDYELGVINKMGYAPYFIIIYDFLAFCEKQKIPVGPGRGSAAGSLVAYALNITRIDPIAYNLLFERFLNPERVTMPDIDIDFCIKRRSEVIDYISQFYGKERVSQIITFGTMAARGVIRDVGRALGIDLRDVDRIAKLIPSTPGQYTSIPEALEAVPELKQLYNGSDTFKRLIDIGTQLEGAHRHTSVHAAGVVISRDPLSTIVPMVVNDGQSVTQFAMTELESVGLLKMDILGLRNLTVMQDALALITQHHGITLDLDSLNISDTPTYQLLCAGDTIGVFQLESKGMRTLIKDLQPQVFEDIIALLALYRPGPLGSGMVNEFISNKSGKTKPKYDLDVLEPILKETYGLIVYQEQVMQIASTVGGFTLGEADMLRRAMGKKKKDVMDKMRARFLDGAKQQKFNSATAEKIFDLMYKFAEYGFNKSHSAAYAMISYQTAFLKANYPTEYMAALLSSVLGVSDKVSLYIQECQKMGLTIYPPSVNDPHHGFSIVKSTENSVNPETLNQGTPSKTDKASKTDKRDKTDTASPSPDGYVSDNQAQGPGLRVGLGAIKNVGDGAIASIIEARKQGPYKDLVDFALRVDMKQVNKRVVESLIKSGSMDTFGDRSWLLSVYEKVLNNAQVLLKERQNGQVGLFGNQSIEMGINIDDDGNYIQLTDTEKLRMEKELIGLYISGHPLQNVLGLLAELPHAISTIIPEMDGQFVKVGGILTAVRKVTTRSQKEMLIGTLEDQKSSITLLMFENEQFQKAAAIFQLDHIVTVSGKVRFNNDELSIMCDTIDLLDTAAQTKSIVIDATNMTQSLLEDIKQIALRYKGEIPLYFQVSDKRVRAGKKYWVSQDELCLKQLESIIGTGHLLVNVS